MNTGEKTFNNTYPVPLSITIGSLSDIFLFTPVTQGVTDGRPKRNKRLAGQNISVIQDVIQC